MASKRKSKYELLPTGGPGAPTVITEQVIRDLCEAFSYEWTVLKACDYAGISPTAYYEFLKKQPEFKCKFELARESGLDAAQKHIYDTAKKDVNTAKWLIERRRKDQFAPQQKVDITHTLTADQQLLDKINEYRQLEHNDDVQEAEVIEVKPLPDIG